MRHAVRIAGVSMLLIAVGCMSAGCMSMEDLADKLALVPTKPVEPPNTFIPDWETHPPQVLGDNGFEIAESNRYDGRIETVPRIAPGVLLFLKPGSPSFYERSLATLQTYRHRVSVVIQPAENVGFFLEVIARKELEDLARPIKQTAGAAIFRTDNSVERQFEVIDPNVFDSTWIFKGRDPELEQKLIQRLKCLM
jgi:hypothetical protein